MALHALRCCGPRRGLRKLTEAIVLSWVVALIFGTGCKPRASATSDSSASVGVILGDDRHPRTQWLAHSLREAADEHGLSIEMVFHREKSDQLRRLREWSGQQQAGKAAGEEARSQRKRVIVLHPLHESGWEDVLESVRAQRVPVITIDRELELRVVHLFTTHIGPAPSEQGTRAARVLAAELAFPSVVLEIEGEPSGLTRSRSLAFESVLSELGDVQIVRWGAAELEQALTDPLQAFPVVTTESGGKATTYRGVFIHRSSDVETILRLIRDAGARPGRDVPVVCVGAEADRLLDVQSGKLLACVEDNPLLGPWAMEAVESLLHRQPVTRRVEVPVRTLDATQIMRVLPDQRY